MPPRNLLPQALSATGDNQSLRDFYALQAADALSQDVDPTPFIEEARRQREGGNAAMLNALAAQYAGQDFQPVQGMFLKRAMAARDPVQVGNAGYVNDRGQFIKTPGYDQSRKAQLSQTLSQLFGQRYSDEVAAQTRADARADRAANREPFSIQADPVNGGFVRFDKRNGSVTPIDGMPGAPPRPANGPTGFPKMPGSLKIPEASTKNMLGASMLAEHLPKFEEILRLGYVPTKQDILAVGPVLDGVQGKVQSVTPRKWASPQASTFYNLGGKILTAILRPESGGAITPDEWQQYGPLYLPWSDDTPEERQRKVEDLRNYMRRLAAGSGPAARYFEAPPVAGGDEGVIDLPAPGGG